MADSAKWLDKPEAKRGREAEKSVATWLMSEGYYVIPSYDYAGEDHEKPPRLQGEAKGYPVPDLDVAKDGRRSWIEVKLKAKASWTRHTQRFEHGIAKRLVDAYTTVASITATPVWIVIVEEQTQEWLAALLDSLRTDERVTNSWMGEMVYWPRTAFRRIRKVKP